MAFENELQKLLHNWLAEQSNSLSQSILDGSCKDFAEYKERCGKLRAMWETEDEVKRIQRQRNSLTEANDDTTTGNK